MLQKFANATNAKGARDAVFLSLDKFEFEGKNELEALLYVHFALHT